MKAGWKSKKLGEVCDLINRGISPKYVESDGLIVLNQKCIRDHQINFDQSRLHDLKSKGVSKERFIQVGDVLVNSTGTGTLGRVAQVKKLETDSTVDSHITIVRPKKDLFYSDYFGFAMIFIENEIAKMGEGCGGQTELARNTLKNEFEIAYPESISEQERISKMLDEVFEKTEQAKDNSQKNLQNAKDVFDSFLYGIFVNPGKNWTESKLGELGQITSSKRIFKSEYVESGVPFYRITEIKELANNKDISTDIFISKQRYEEIKKSYGVPKEGDLLMTAVGTIGEIYVVKNNNPFYFKDGNVLWFKNFVSINPNFLKLILQNFVENIRDLTKGAAYNALTIEKLEMYKIFIPPLIEQNSIVAKLENLTTETNKLEAVYVQQLNRLENLKKSVLNQAFSGNL